MSTFPPLKDSPKATLANLIDLVAADGTIPEASRREIVSAIRTTAKVVKLEPHMIVASPRELRNLINNALPTSVGVSASRWSNAKSLVRKALALLDPDVIPARSRAALLPEWAVLLAAPEAQALHRGLARFSKFCSGRGVAPAAVNQTVYDAFHDALEEHCLVRAPRETQMTAGRAWNKARTLVADWPDTELTIQSMRMNASLPWSAFPSTLREDVDAYLKPQGDDVFDLSRDSPLLRPATIRNKQLQFRQTATALVETGRSPDSIRSLADLVTVDAATAAVRVFYKRSYQAKTARTYAIAYLLLATARDWVKPDAAIIKSLETLARRMNPKRTGMTAKKTPSAPARRFRCSARISKPAGNDDGRGVRSEGADCGRGADRPIGGRNRNSHHGTGAREQFGRTRTQAHTPHERWGGRPHRNLP